MLYCYIFCYAFKAIFMYNCSFTPFNLFLVSRLSCIQLFIFVPLKIFRLLGVCLFRIYIFIVTSFRWHVVIRMSFIMFVYIQIWCIPFHYHLKFFDNLEETGTRARVLFPAVGHQLVSIIENDVN